MVAGFSDGSLSARRRYGSRVVDIAFSGGFGVCEDLQKGAAFCMVTHICFSEHGAPRWRLRMPGVIAVWKMR